MGKFAKRTPTQLHDIGRYIKKQIVNNLQNDLRVRNAMESYSCIIQHCVDSSKVLSAIDDFVVECCHTLLLEGFNHNNVDYLMYAMQTLKSLIKSSQDRFFAFQRLSDIFDLLIKIGRSEHMESEYYTTTPSHHHSTYSQVSIARSESYNHSSPFQSNKMQSNINGFTEKTIIYHALDTLKLSVEYSKNQVADTKFTELMSLFIYNLRHIDMNKAMLSSSQSSMPHMSTINKDAPKGEVLTQQTSLSPIDVVNNKTASDIEQISTKGFELLCGQIAGFNNDKLHFTLEFSSCFM